VIRAGEIQVMSAGTGIYHSEYNYRKDHPVKFLQIWLFPNKRNVSPRYQQIQLDASKSQNQFNQILSPDPHDEGVWIYQDAWFHLGNFDDGVKVDYQLKLKGNNGVYVFVLSGDIQVNGITLNARDGSGIWEVDQIAVKALNKASVLLMEVPMA
jgi:redox-sensitive bicupin YhaK (pirin superfamily)